MRKRTYTGSEHEQAHQRPIHRLANFTELSSVMTSSLKAMEMSTSVLSLGQNQYFFASGTVGMFHRLLIISCPAQG